VNVAFLLLVVSAALAAAVTGTAAEVGKAALDSAKSAVDLVLGLTGSIVLFVGLMAIVEKAGGLRFLARAIRPILLRLFPEIPADHPAMGAMVMNLAANALGLGNAATPFGLEAMRHLRSLQPRGDQASDAMCLFLAINTSGLALLPTGVIATRAALGSADAAAILPTTLVATACSTATAVAAALLLRRLWSRAEVPPPEQTEAVDVVAAAEPAAEPAADPATHLGADAVVELPPGTGLRAWLPALAIALSLGGLVVAVARLGDAASAWILPGLITAMVLYGAVRRVPVYEVFIDAARDGLQTALGIIPYLVAVLVAVGMLRASGAVDAVVGLLAPLLDPLGVPPEVLPLALLRPLSGSGAFGLCAELLETHGPDSPIGQLASTLVGSTETTFYVLAVYFGSVGVTRPRWALLAGLLADAAGAVASVIAVRWLLL
jgi:spore maturation protein SpmA